jgi:hypothetical protein
MDRDFLEGLDSTQCRVGYQTQTQLDDENSEFKEMQNLLDEMKECYGLADGQEGCPLRAVCL